MYPSAFEIKKIIEVWPIICNISNQESFCIIHLSVEIYTVAWVDGRDASSLPLSIKLGGMSSKTSADSVVASTPSIPHSDIYHIGLQSQRSSLRTCTLL